MFRTVTLDDAAGLPRWRRPETLLMVMAFAMPLAFSVWMAVLNNFIIEIGGFDGRDNGWLQTIREIPGFLTFLVIYLLLIFREQTLAFVALVLLGVAVAVTGYFPSFAGLAITTILSSIGFHYFEAVYQSLQLQWLDKERAPKLIGWMVAVGSVGSLVAYGGAWVGTRVFGAGYETIYLTGGLAAVSLALFCRLAYPQFEEREAQHKKVILRRRYWLFYALTFMGGARRQIFVVFAGFMMVEKFGFRLHEVIELLLLNYIAMMVIGPYVGRFIARFGERRALMIEYLGLILVFFCYAGLYFFDWGVALAVVLYILDHLLFAMAIAQKTYFQKIADPKDIAPTSAVSFTINHIAAVALPAMLGYLWLVSPGAVFGLGSIMAVISLGLAFMVPRTPVVGRETVFASARMAARPAE